MKHWLTTKEVASMLQVSPQTVRRLGIPVKILGPRTYRYDPDAVDQYMAGNSKRMLKMVGR